MEKQYLTVTALTRYIKAKIDRDPHLQAVWLKGEISNFKYHSRGHMYFTLKDENARISAVMFSNQNRNIAFQPEDGMKVLVKGKVSVFEANGTYQIYVNEMQPDGIGNLYLAYEQLKTRLHEEGLFSERYKQRVPVYPKTIGVVTSPTGAAVRDILTTLKRRYPIAHIVVFPALVQGEFAAPSIVNAIETANKMNRIDVLIVGRGGGSIEELWAFNEEMVARAIFSSKVPVISAVGHETDFTIADFVADMRAPTPTAAAELAVPNIVDVQEKVIQRTIRLQRRMNEQLQRKVDKLTNLQNAYAFRYPHQLYRQKEEQFDRMLEELVRAQQRVMENKQKQIEQLTLSLHNHHPQQKIDHAKLAFNTLEKQLKKELHNVLRVKEFTFTRALSKLETLSPLNVMKRGYSAVYSEEKHIIKSIQQVEIGDRISVQLQDGMLNCNVSEIEERDINNGTAEKEL
ncbi:exodeoxyribonuclease VII large subunit [Bacillus sp. 165]|uniref:exodeoxyribonuclease VII large subunit n=1 Tax=Bacillus sp. 165 TaxID=1529117 RepID=UPI001ADB2DA9|nr:exodeoxyribonuclease VII large subunit [Bacillus sp. 165]MBO9129714.1 exodeoxyribonuclease VII large subunit [Bacillus sp. 165]